MFPHAFGQTFQIDVRCFADIFQFSISVEDHNLLFGNIISTVVYLAGEEKVT